jgi:hypothetical protein
MRTIVAALIVAAIPFVAPAGAAEPHFCAIEKDGTRNCSFASMAQCQTAMTLKTDKCVQDGVVAARPVKAESTISDELEKILDRVNKKSESLILCRGC